MHIKTQKFGKKVNHWQKKKKSCQILASAVDIQDSIGNSLYFMYDCSVTQTAWNCFSSLVIIPWSLIISFIANIAIIISSIFTNEDITFRQKVWGLLDWVFFLWVFHMPIKFLLFFSSLDLESWFDLWSPPEKIPIILAIRVLLLGNLLTGNGRDTQTYFPWARMCREIITCSCKFCSCKSATQSVCIILTGCLLVG